MLKPVGDYDSRGTVRWVRGRKCKLDLVMVQCKLEGWHFDNTSMLWASCIIRLQFYPGVWTGINTERKQHQNVLCE